MDEKLDRIVEAVQQINLHLENLRVSLGGLIVDSEDHEQRLRLIERWQHRITPILVLLTFLLGALCTQILDRLI